MSSSSENDFPDSEQLHGILQQFYSNDPPSIISRSNACAFFEETVDKKRCVTEDRSFIPPSPFSSCLVYSCYSMIKQFQENYVKNLVRESLFLGNEGLLNFFVSRWNIFESGSIRLDFVCHSLIVHLSRHHQYLPTLKIHVLALRFWDLHCRNFTGNVTHTAMQMINKERRGESINTLLVHETMRLLVQINDSIEKCYYTTPKQEQIGSLPPRTLPAEFIYHNNVCRFYRLERGLMLSRYSADEYLEKVKHILAEEYKKCKFSHHIPQHIVDYVQQSLAEIFIGNKESVLIPDFKNAVAASNISMLEDFYSVLRIAASSDLFDSFSKAFCDSATLDGKTIMENRAEEFLMQPELYMTTYLQIMRKYTSLVEIIFDNNEDFKKANEKALASILNHSIPSENKASTPCEYFAIYCDFMLKEPKAYTAHSNNELTCIFKFLENDCLFEDIFYELLVKSLICATNINEVYERDILLFVETFWKGSYNFITKERIRDMIKDIRTSKDLNYEFATDKSIHSVGTKSELVVRVLKDENWPLAKQNFSGPLPKSLSVEIDSFSAFHKKNYPHKKLTFLHKISQAEVVAHCFRKKYNFHLNLNQLILLSQFNQAESWPIKQLLEDTKIDQKSFDHVIENFIEAGILKYKEDDDSNSKTSVMLNLDYENEKDCVRLSELKDGIEEAMKVSKNTDDYVISEGNKCLSIQAAIVRIMKKELRLNHDELVTRIFEAMETKFSFTLDIVNKSIDKLMKDDYIGRSQESERHYVYIP